jgi:hypothetical protein
MGNPLVTAGFSLRVSSRGDPGLAVAEPGGGEREAAASAVGAVVGAAAVTRWLSVAVITVVFCLSVVWLFHP